MPTPSHNPLGRPVRAFNRRRYSEAVRFLKLTIQNPKIAVPARIHCVALLMSIYGDLVPPTRAIKEQVRDLVTSHNVVGEISARIDKKLAQEAADRAARLEQEKAEAHDAQIQATFSAVLNDALDNAVADTDEDGLENEADG